MLNSNRSKQIIVLIGMVVLVAFLFTREIKVLEAPKEETATPASAPQTEQTVTFTIEEASATAKNLIGNNLAKEITLLEGKYKKAKGNEQTEQAKYLAQKWEDVEQAIPSAMYLEVAATNDSNLQNWILAGNRFLKAFDNATDTVVRPIMLQKAHGSFSKAMNIDSNNTEAKTGLGVTIVNGMGAPMQGIAMLREVVEKDPKNLKANMNLGVFAIRSGQFDKAIIRFNDIVKNIKETPEAYLYLASAYESLGKDNEAIDAYLSSKKIAANPTVTKYIDQRIAEIKNKR